jgi:predicted ABC-type transport system involved in lysophospholipase L1 biosynthesis ATPase subunit
MSKTSSVTSAGQTAEYILVARGLHKTYSLDVARLDVLKGIELQVARKESVALVGASGAGKSTLMHVLGGLDRPTSGEVWLEGESIYELPSRQLTRLRNRKVGFVFQAYQLLPDLEAVENVALAGWVARRPVAQVRKKAEDLLAAVGLAGRVHHRPVELSGGEQQRVAIARALINDPILLFADEPIGNLDSTTGAGVMELLLRLQRERGMTLILVTHDVGIAQQCQRVLEIRDGVLNGVLKARQEQTVQ